MEILPIIGNEKPFESEFFTGDENKKFDDTMAFQQIIQNFQISYNLKFVKTILTTNKLKIHVETGNIY